MLLGKPPASVLRKLREAGLHTVIYGLGSVLTSALGFLLLPLYTKYFDSAAFGALTLIQLMATLAGSFFYVGASSALARFYFDQPEGSARQAVVATAVWLTVAGALAQIALGWIAAPSLARVTLGDQHYVAAIRVALIGSAFTFVSQLFLQLLRFRRKSTSVVILNMASLVAIIALVWVLLAHSSMGVLAPLLATTIVQGGAMFALALLVRHDLALAWSRAEARPLLALGLASTMLGLAYYVLSATDRFLLNKLGSLSDVGVYSLGYRIGMVIQMLFIAPFSQIWAPMRMENRRAEDQHAFLAHGLTYFAFLGIAATLTLSLFAPEITDLASSRAEYHGAYRVVPLVMLAHLCYGAINIVDYGLWVERKNHLAIFAFLAAIAVNAGLNAFAIPRWGYMGAAAVTVVSYAFTSVAVYWIADRYFSIAIDRRIFIAGLGAAVALAAGALVAEWRSGLALRLALWLASTAGLVLLLTTYERVAIGTLFAKLRGR